MLDPRFYDSYYPQNLNPVPPDYAHFVQLIVYFPNKYHVLQTKDAVTFSREAPTPDSQSTCLMFTHVKEKSGRKIFSPGQGIF